MNNDILLVPVQVDSLFLPKDSLMAEPLADFSRLPYFNGKRDVNADVAYVSENFVSPPIQNRNLRFRKGLHLHWALPDALAHGVHRQGATGQEQSSVHYPALPDRWWVRREPPGPGSANDWIVESNFLWPEEQVYALLEPVEESLKRAMRQVRNFESLPEATRKAMTVEAKVSRLREVIANLAESRDQLESRLADPAFSFFESLWVRLDYWVFRLSAATADIENAGLDDLYPGLKLLLDHHFEQRFDSIAYPVKPEHIRAAPILQAELAPRAHYLQRALRQINVVMASWEATALTDAVKKERLAQMVEYLAAFENAFMEMVQPRQAESHVGRLLAQDFSIDGKTYPRLAPPISRDVAKAIHTHYTTGNSAGSPDKLPLLTENVSTPEYAGFRSAVYAETGRLLAEMRAVFAEGATLPDKATFDAWADALLAMVQAGLQAPAVPLESDRPDFQPFRYMGRTYALDNRIREDRKRFSYLNRLTVIGYGEPTFAAFYPNCNSVFGFHDPEVAATENPVYQVLGWYDRPEDEYLVYLNGGKEEDLAAAGFMEKAKWQLPADKVRVVRQGTRLVCFSRLEHKNLTDGSEGVTVKSGDANITLANTGREALAALLAHKIAPPDKAAQVEDQLESIFFMDDLDQHQLDLGPKFRETRHAQGFNSSPGEQLYEIRVENNEIATDTQTTAAQPPVPVLPAELATSLQTLNYQKRQFDHAIFQRDALREQLFVDWYKYMLSAYPPQDSPLDYPDVDEVRFFIEQNDIRPLLDLMYQTGQTAQFNQDGTFARYRLPHDYWQQELGMPRLTDQTWNVPANLHEAVQRAWEAMASALHLHNNRQASAVGRADITDWTRLIDHLSHPSPSPALSSLIDSVRTTEMGPALGRLSTLKKRVLQALNAGWVNAEKEADVHYILGRFGLVPEIPEEFEKDSSLLPPIEHQHIIHWKALLLTLRQQNPPKVQAVIDVFKARFSNRATFQRDLEGYLDGVGDQRPLASVLEAEDANLSIMVDTLKDAVGSGANALDRRKALAASLPKAFRASPEFVLKEISGPRFYEPKEPTVLIAGDIARPSNRFGRDGRLSEDGTLPIGDWQFIASDTLEADWTAVLDRLHHLVLANKQDASQDTIGFHESNGAPWNPFMLEWSVELRPLQEKSNARDGEYQEDYIRHHYDLKVNAVDLEEKPGSTVARGRNPNIYLQRSLLTTHAQRSMEDMLKPYVEERQGQTPAKNDVDDPLFTARQAWAQIKAPDMKAGQPDLSTAGPLRGKILSQALSGFNAAMLMLQENFQLPVDDPIGFDDYRKFTHVVARLAGFGTQRSPNPLTDFSPIRTGVLELNTLRLVDTFGRIADLDVNGTDTVPSSLGPLSGGHLRDAKGKIIQPVELHVPPRLAQAARLHFRWLSAEPDPQLVNDIIPESVNAPSSTPICGWLMANQLDRSLVVFDAKGKSLGAIDADGERVLWRPAPGWESLTDPGIIPNEHLRKVVAYLLKQSGTFIESFLDNTNAILRSIEPESFEQQQSLALLMGRPMAVVRANIDLELKGVPAVHHSWEAFFRSRNQRVTEGAGNDGVVRPNAARETDLYTRVRFPIRIGAVSQLNDGLIGYWLEEPYQPDETDKKREFRLKEDSFYLNIARNQASNPQGTVHYLPDDPPTNPSQDAGTPISQSLDVDDPDQTICLLMDPRAAIHAFTGILPTKVIDLPAEQYRDALAAIDITFLTTPVLTPAERISVPRPVEQGYEWQWIEKVAARNSLPENWKWLEVREFPAISRPAFLNQFSSILWEQLKQSRWLNPDTDKALPVSERPALSPEFARLSEALGKAAKEGETITPAQLDGISGVLLDQLLLRPNVFWLEVVAVEGGPKMYRIVPKEARKSTSFAGFAVDFDGLSLDFGGTTAGNKTTPGFETRVDAILVNTYQSFRPAAEAGHFFPEQVWIREGWLKLQKADF